MKTQLTKEQSEELFAEYGIHPKYASLPNSIFSLDDMKHLLEMASSKEFDYFESGGEWFVEPKEDEELKRIVEEGGDYPGGCHNELIDAILDFIDWWPEYLNTEIWKS